MRILSIGKTNSSSFSSSSINSNKPFDLIHCDIWGGHYVASLSRAHYFLTIVDDFSRCTWVYLMRFKSETIFFLKSFFRMVETQFGCCIKCIHSDNGAEFFSHDLISFFRDCGVVQQHSCISTVQQNGVPKQKHRHLFNSPLTFWGE